MMKVAAVLLLLSAVLACADSRVKAHRGLVASNGLVPENHPYLFLSVPRGRSGAIVQGFEVVDEDDDDDDGNTVVDNDEMISDDDHDDDEYAQAMPRRVVAVLDDNDNNDDDSTDVDDDDGDVDDPMSVDGQVHVAKKPTNMQLVMKNAKATHMMVSRQHAGAIMVPDGVIEIEGQSVVDEKTGKAALLVPRAALEAIPDGSVVALMERSFDETEEERANRVVVRRRRKGSRRNVKRRGSNNRNRRRRGGNKVRRGNNRVRVVYRGGNKRRGGVRRGSRPMVIQG